MNIFFLDKDPATAAKWHCDEHIVKMAIEYAQLLSTAIHETGSTVNEWVYKPTHKNHPCSIWVRQSLSHWAWLWKLGHHVGNEFTTRYHKIHKSTRVLRCLPVPNKLPDLGWLSDPPQTMPDEFKCEDTIQAYRNFYLYDKSRFATWKFTEPPKWWQKTGGQGNV